VRGGINTGAARGVDRSYAGAAGGMSAHDLLQEPDSPFR
jgi:hypothetical protein